MRKRMPVVENIRVSDTSIQIVGLRSLHAFLEIDEDFERWTQYLIKQYNLVEHVDYATLLSVVTKDEPPEMECVINLNAAYRLARDDSNRKDELLYLCECMSVFSTQSIGASLGVIDLAKLRDARNEELKKVMEGRCEPQKYMPKMQLHEVITTISRCRNMYAAASVIGAGYHDLLEMLRGDGVLMDNNLPCQQSIEAGLFIVVEEQFTDERGVHRICAYALVTEKGVGYIQQQLESLQESLEDTAE